MKKELHTHVSAVRSSVRVRGWICLSVLLLAGVMTGCAEKRQAPRPISAPVTVATAVSKDMPLQINAIGTVESLNTVQIKSMVNGEIQAVHFREGQDVRKGELLFTIDRRQPEADLRRAEATLAKDLATAQNARAEARRYQALMKEGIVAQQTADQMQSAAEAAEALVVADRAAVQNAKVQLQYTKIYAPISGRTGNLQVQLGNLVKANDTLALVTINQISPIYTTFTIPEQLLGRVKEFMAKRKLAVSAVIPNDPRPAVGSLTFIDNSVDRQTGTIKLKGTFNNADRRLWPGQFTNVTLTLATEPNAIVVPTQAVQNGQQGQFVYVVGGDMKAESRSVRVDRTVGDQAVIAQGIKAGETVVTDGQVRLTPGARVEIKSSNSAADTKRTAGLTQ